MYSNPHNDKNWCKNVAIVRKCIKNAHLTEKQMDCIYAIGDVQWDSLSKAHKRAVYWAKKINLPIEADWIIEYLWD